MGIIKKVSPIVNIVIYIALTLLIMVVVLLVWVMLDKDQAHNVWIWLTNKFSGVKTLFKAKGKTSMLTKSVVEMIDSYRKANYRPMSLKSTGDLKKDLKAWILLKEGGLTDNQNDSAHTFPAPITYTVVKGGRSYTSNKWHTNKGVTYRAFLDSAKDIGYTATPSLFIQMPDEIPFKIFEKKYADAYKENSGSPLIDYLGALWAWGSGVGGEKALFEAFVKENKMSLADLNKRDPELLFANLVLYRIKFFERLAQKKPQNKVFLKGWINSELNFYDHFKKYV